MLLIGFLFFNQEEVDFRSKFIGKWNVIELGELIPNPQNLTNISMSFHNNGTVITKNSLGNMTHSQVMKFKIESDDDLCMYVREYSDYVICYNFHFHNNYNVLELFYGGSLFFVMEKE
jgi:hypothetical protein